MLNGMRDYFELLDELKSKGINALEGDFYDYRGLPLEKEFELFYQFCQEYLDRDDLGFNINQARFYYNTNTDVNGLAFSKANYLLVEIYKGTIFGLKAFFEKKKESFNLESLSNYKNIIEVDGISPDYFLFQYVTLYFLYHEVAHLIQRSVGSADYKEFASVNCEGDDVVSQHIREHDADWFAANQIAFHLKPFATKITDKSKGEFKTVLEDVTSLALAGIYMYFIQRAKSYPEIYYQEKCHPHPSVRLSYMIIYLLDALSENIPFKINQQSVLKNAILISEILMKEPDRNIIEEYSLQLQLEIASVEKYINKIRQDAENYPYTSLKVLFPK